MDPGFLIAAWLLLGLGSAVSLLGIAGLLEVYARRQSGQLVRGRVVRMLEVRAPQGWMLVPSVECLIDNRIVTIEARCGAGPRAVGEQAAVYLPAGEVRGAIVLGRRQSKEYAAGLLGTGLLILIVGATVMGLWAGGLS